MTKYFTSPQLSEKLEKLGCESQFRFCWCDQEVGVDDLSFCTLHFKHQKAFHWSDICLPENAVKIWPLLTLGDKLPNYFGPPQKYLMDHIYADKDWQSFVEQAVDKRLNEK